MCIQKERKIQLTLHTLVLSFDYIEQIFMTDILFILFRTYKYVLYCTVADLRLGQLYVGTH